MRNLMKSALVAMSLVAVAAPALAADPAPAEAAKPAFSTEGTTIGEILDNPELLAIVDKFMPGFSTNPMTEQGRPITLRFAMQFKPDEITPELLDKIDAEFAKIPAK